MIELGWHYNKPYWRLTTPNIPLLRHRITARIYCTSSLFFVLACFWNKSQHSDASKLHQKRSFTLGLLLHISSKHNKQKQQNSFHHTHHFLGLNTGSAIPPTASQTLFIQLAIVSRSPLTPISGFFTALSSLALCGAVVISIRTYARRTDVMRHLPGAGIIANTRRSCICIRVRTTRQAGQLGRECHGLRLWVR